MGILTRNHKKRRMARIAGRLDSFGRLLKVILTDESYYEIFAEKKTIFDKLANSLIGELHVLSNDLKGNVEHGPAPGVITFFEAFAAEIQDFERRVNVPFKKKDHKMVSEMLKTYGPDMMTNCNAVSNSIREIKARQF